MSLELINHSQDLKKLRDEGYEVTIEKGYLLINNIPYVNNQKEIVRGILSSTLEVSGDRTTKPSTHVVFWVGTHPCDSKGSEIANLANQRDINRTIREGLIANFSFSQKPGPEGYSDYYKKMTSYIKIIEGHAHAIDPTASAQTFDVISSDGEESVFVYIDTASSRAGVSTVNDKLKQQKIAIVGLGGTGAYVLDLLAKTPIEEIRLFDGDTFLQHNAFRSPGAASIDDLTRKQSKVEYFAGIYSHMHKNILPHFEFIDETNVSKLNDLDFVFLCIEGANKKVLVEHLIEKEKPFIDVGIGMYCNNDTLGGNVRITTCTPDFHDHIEKRISFADGEEDEYSTNIQIADMNALNAALAVIKWKKTLGFYFDEEHEHNTIYGIITNQVSNEDTAYEAQKDET